MLLTKEDVSMYLDNTTSNQVWSKQDRAEFGILSEYDSPKRFANTFVGADPYMKEVKQSKGKLLNTIQDKLGQLKEQQEALPWE